MEGLFVTGQVLGFVGKKENSNFVIKDVIYPDELKLEKQISHEQVCFIADLQINDSIEKIKIIQNYLQKNRNITILVIIGNFFKVTKENSEILASFIKTFDIETFIIPNINDPTNVLLPQEPINKKKL